MLTFTGGVCLNRYVIRWDELRIDFISDKRKDIASLRCRSTRSTGGKEFVTQIVERRSRWMASRGKFPKLGPIPASDRRGAVCMPCLVRVFSPTRSTNPTPSPPSPLNSFQTPPARPRHPML